MNTVVLAGAEDALRAGHIMRDAASEMRRAVGELSEVLDYHRTCQEEYLLRFEAAVERLASVPKEKVE